MTDNRLCHLRPTIHSGGSLLYAIQYSLFPEFGAFVSVQKTKTQSFGNCIYFVPEMKGVESVIHVQWSSGLMGNVPSPVPVCNTSCLLQIGVTHCSPHSKWQAVFAQV